MLISDLQNNDLIRNTATRRIAMVCYSNNKSATVVIFDLISKFVNEITQEWQYLGQDERQIINTDNFYKIGIGAIVVKANSTEEYKVVHRHFQEQLFIARLATLNNLETWERI